MERAVSEAVFAEAVQPRAMVYRDFSDLVAETFDQRRDEPMHTMKGDKGFNALSPHSLEGASGIPDAIFGESAPDGICDLALHTLEPGVLAICSVSTDQIRALVDLRQEPRDIIRVVL